MQLNSILNICIAIVSCCIAFPLSVQPVHVLLNFCSSCQIRFTEFRVDDSFIVKSTTDSILVGRQEFVDHVPEKLILMGSIRWHFRTEISEIILTALNLILDLLSNERKVYLNVSEKNLGELFDQSRNT